MVAKFQMTRSKFTQLPCSPLALPLTKIQAVPGVGLGAGRGEQAACHVTKLPYCFIGKDVLEARIENCELGNGEWSV